MPGYLCILIESEKVRGSVMDYYRAYHRPFQFETEGLHRTAESVEFHLEHRTCGAVWILVSYRGRRRREEKDGFVTKTDGPLENASSVPLTRSFLVISGSDTDNLA